VLGGALCCALLCATTVNADQPAAAKAAELEQLRARIQTLQSELQANRTKKSQAESLLQDVERSIGFLTTELARIDAGLQDSRRQLERLQKDRQAALARLQTQSDQLGGEARAAYMMGRQQQVKLLMNQEQPAVVGRMLTYFNYISRARSASIAAMRTSLTRIGELQAQIEQQNQQLVSLRRDQQLQTEQLQAQRQQRQALVAALEKQLALQGGELQGLKQDARQLQALIESLQEVLADIPVDSGQGRPFRELQGQLHWPADGRLAQRFGSERGTSGLRWQGVLIAAPEGGKVRAVSQGRVAFADWMRGFGLLLILDHGDGYMSLYGQNQALYKEVGEWVDSGEVVATLGASGGQTETGLYFELRHNGRPVNPLGWCTGQPRAASG
jgi:septal ring factor EnvC (AmiA/AmiB activator)